MMSEDYRKGGSSDHNTIDHYIRHQDVTSVAVTTVSGANDYQDASFQFQNAVCKRPHTHLMFMYVVRNFRCCVALTQRTWYHSDDEGCPEDISACVSLMSINFQGAMHF